MQRRPASPPRPPLREAALNERIMSELTTLSDYQKCRSVFRSVCEGVDCELSYAELEALESNGFIAKLHRVKRNRWSFEWTDALRDFALATPAEQQRIIRSLEKP